MFCVSFLIGVFLFALIKQIYTFYNAHDEMLHFLWNDPPSAAMPSVIFIAFQHNAH